MADSEGSSDDLDRLHFYMAQALDNFGLADDGGHPDFDLDLYFDHDLMDDDYDDDDLHDMYFSDDYDSSFSGGGDSDNEHAKIFVSLQDSAVMSRLCFHKTVGRYRLPRVDLTRPETYESVYHILGELEILLKVWKKRTQHPFTAHLTSQEREEDRAKDRMSRRESEEAEVDYFRYGHDYEEDDLQHESDFGSDVSFIPSGKGKNETLTKKKYCQSTRFYYEIFHTDRQFDQFFSCVHKIRKHIHATVFTLFMEAIPVEMTQKLPGEIWEKIWKYTQTPYHEVESFHVGTKANSEEEKELEVDRIKDLFGAIGNFHMLVFELLFKHLYITLTPPLMELESLEVWTTGESSTIKVHYAKALFDKFRKILDRSFIRLLDLDSNTEEDVICKDSDLSNLIDRGNYTLHHQLVSKSNSAELAKTRWIRDSLFISSQTCQDVIAFVGGTVRSNENKGLFFNNDHGESFVSVVIYNVVKNKTVAVINTGLKHLEVISGMNRNNPRKLCTLGKDRFGLLVRTSSKEKDAFVIHQWKFDPEGDVDQIVGTCSKIESELAVNPKSVQPFNIKTSIEMILFDLAGVATYCVCYQNPYIQHSGLKFFDADKMVELPGKALSFKGKEVNLECIKDKRVFLRDSTSREFLFCDVENSKVLETYKDTDLCKDANHDHESGRHLDCEYAVKMDMCSDRHQFLIFCQNMTSFQLFDYEDEDDMPMVIASGSTLVYELRWRDLSKTALLDGHLFGHLQREVALRNHSSLTYGVDDTDTFCQDIFEFNCRQVSFHPIASLFSDIHPNLNVWAEEDMANGGKMAGPVHEAFKSFHQSVLLNEFSRRCFLSSVKHSNIYFSSENTLILPEAFSFLKVQFYLNSKEVKEEDIRQLMFIKSKVKEVENKKLEEKRQREEMQRLKAQQMREREETNKKRKQEAKEKYLGQAVQLSGRIQKWSYSYGFISIFESDARPLGNIFVHLSDISNRPPGLKIKLGQKVKFHVEGQPQNKMKAVRVFLQL